MRSIARFAPGAQRLLQNALRNKLPPFADLGVCGAEFCHAWRGPSLTFCLALGKSPVDTCWSCLSGKALGATTTAQVLHLRPECDADGVLRADERTAAAQQMLRHLQIPASLAGLVALECTIRTEQCNILPTWLRHCCSALVCVQLLAAKCLHSPG